jgi:O-antigen ligase
MALTSHSHQWQQTVANVGAFLVPGLALCIPSGYSYGAVLLLLGAAMSFRGWRKLSFSQETWWLVVMYLSMACLWLMHVGEAWGWRSFDRASKYLMAVPCVFFLMTFRPHFFWLWMGVASGAISSGAVALYQINISGAERASGFTNAIQYGNLSVLLAAISAAALVVSWPVLRVWQRCLLSLAVFSGLLASVLSQSRGGWLALVLALPVLAWLSAGIGSRRWVLLCSGALAVGLVFAAQTNLVGSRIGSARAEIQLFQKSGDADSSVGHRLAHGRLALQMGLDKPWFGWGHEGYIEEKARRVTLGHAHPVVNDYHHVHNEVLENFVKRGVFGVILLLAFYAVPLFIFWPTERRIRKSDGSLDRVAAALCIAGVLIPLLYAGFGLTQVFLWHNNGNMLYLLMCPLVLAALERHRMGEA